MRTPPTRAIVCALATVCSTTVVAAPPAEEVIVWGRPLSPFVADPGLAPLAETNTARLLKRIAGANVNFNGTLAGIAQYRGMYGDRVNVSIDGMAIGNACSNNMDAPLHYLPRTFVDRIEVVRGIAPVSSGLESIGGTVFATSRVDDFGANATPQLRGHIAGGGQSVDGGYSATGDFVLTNARHRLHAAASREHGGNRDFGDGTIRPTRYARNAADFGYAFKLDGDTLSIDYRRNETGESGTPALPMDDIRTDGDLVRGRYEGSRGTTTFSAELYWNGIDHLMSNYHMRAALPGRRRDSPADADSIGWRLQADFPLAAGALRIGADGHMLDYDSDITSPDDPAFFVRNFNDVQHDRYGIFGEWSLAATGRWDVELGLRWTGVDTDAGPVDASMATMTPALARLRDRFNAADRARHDDHVDMTAIANYAVSDSLSVEFGVARKARSPSRQERYLWLPLETTGGLSDGNLYVGNPNLDPETAWQFEIGLEWQSRILQVTPRVFYHLVDDYIQGVPTNDPAVRMVAAMNGDPTPLEFANVDARLWGIDTEWAVSLPQPWVVQGILSWVRGERRDIDDNLFRIAPLNALVDLAYRREQWSLTLEGELYARQDNVSRSNGERASAGYGLLHLYAQYTFPHQGLTLTGGFENLLDKTYRPHLNGINRVAASDVPVGTRLPGDGRNAFVQIAWQF
jgi:iron complex outermembrane receptor protein